MSDKPSTKTLEGPIVRDESVSNQPAQRQQQQQQQQDEELQHAFASKDAEWHAHMTKKLLRKVDMHLLPVLILMYLLNFLDRSNLAQARLGSLEKDLGMVGSNFNTATSILFVGYILMQLPSNLLLTRVKPSIYLGTVMTIWGAVSAAQAGVKSYVGLVVCRFFLGVIEAPFFPGAIFLMSSWYQRSELGHRFAFFYAGSALANMFGGLLAAGVLGNLDGVHGISGWRYLFIIEGSLTVGVAICSMLVFLLPNYPATTTWLTPEERAYAQWRLLCDADGAGDHADTIPLKQAVKDAFGDYRLYLFTLMQHANLLTQAFTYFFPTVVGTLNYSNTITLLLTVPIWFATFVASLAVTLHSSRTNERTFHIVIPMLIAAIGNVLVISTKSTGARFFAMFLMPLGALPAFQVILAFIVNSFPRPLAKRSVCVAVSNMLGNTASIYGPYMYPKSEGPQYVPGGAATAAVCVLCAVTALVIRVVLKRENRILAKMEEMVDGAAEQREAGAGVAQTRLGVTPGFRYIL